MAKPAALLVHSIGGNATNWDPVLPLLREVNAVAIDLPGHGKSTAPLLTSAEDCARHLEDMRIALGLDAIFAIGQSMGGAVVQCYARDFPQTCRGIVVAHSAASFDVSPQRLLQIETHWPTAQKEFASRQVSHHAGESLRLQAQALVAQREPVVMVNDLRLCNAFCAQAWAAQVKTPVLVIAGDEDPAYGTSRAGELQSLYPNARVEILARCGHNGVLEQPSAFAAAVDGFVSSLLRD